MSTGYTKQENHDFRTLLSAISGHALHSKQDPGLWLYSLKFTEPLVTKELITSGSFALRPGRVYSHVIVSRWLETDLRMYSWSRGYSVKTVVRPCRCSDMPKIKDIARAFPVGQPESSLERLKADTG